MIKLIVGLGNPGLQYEKTRHNAGFLFLDDLASAAGGKWVSSSQFQAEVANISIAGDKLILLKPMTFMNRSGMSVGKLMRYYKVNPEEMLVVHDELDLSAGVVRLKRDGGHAGHNGIRDIMAHAGSKDFYRLRIGIGRPVPGANIADYVLSGLSARAVEDLRGVFQLLLTRLQYVLTGDVAAFNNLQAKDEVN
jgi:PTH1 family peptidyl-tRNA hydrolase